MQACRKLQLTLAILKPELVAHPIFCQEVQKRLLDNNFLFIRSKVLQMNKEKAEGFYMEHKGKFFFDRLVTYMTSGPISVHVLARDDAIKHWRQIMGPTKVFKTMHVSPYSIRGQYGLTDTRNSTHGSDSPVSAFNEIGYFFPDFSTEEWLSREEQTFLQRTQLLFDQESFTHVSQQNDHR